MYPFVPLTYTLPVGYTQFLINYATRYQVYDIDGNAGGVLTPYSYGVSLCPKQFQGDVLFDHGVAMVTNGILRLFLILKNEFLLRMNTIKLAIIPQFIYKRNMHAKGNDAYVGIYPTSNDRVNWKNPYFRMVKWNSSSCCTQGGEKWPRIKIKIALNMEF